MTALTEILDTPIRASDGRVIGQLRDLVAVETRVDGAEDDGAGEAVAEPPGALVQAGADGQEPLAGPGVWYPLVIGALARMSDSGDNSSLVFIPIDLFESLGVGGSRLREDANLDELGALRREPGTIVLKDDLFDRQVVDLARQRIVPVNDLELAESDGEWRVTAVDVGAGGILRRLGLKGVAGWIEGRQAQVAGAVVAPARRLDWRQVIWTPEAGARGPDLAQALRSSNQRLAELAPAPFAHLLEQLSPRQGAALLVRLDDEQVADILEELDDADQAHLLRALDPERAADVLEEMEPDEATDALQGLSEEEVTDLMRRMDREDAAEVEDLLAYDQNTAGGLMTSDILIAPASATLGEIVAALRARVTAADAEEADPLPEPLVDMYIVEPAALNASGAALGEDDLLAAQGRFIGIIPLSRVFLGDPAMVAREVARPIESHIHPDLNAREVAHRIADAHTLALPVLDDEGTLLGAVTVDDAMQVILPVAWRQRQGSRYR